MELARRSLGSSMPVAYFGRFADNETHGLAGDRNIGTHPPKTAILKLIKLQINDFSFSYFSVS